MSRFTKAEPGPNRTVVYYSDDGKRFEYSGGDPNWRNQNPGNLVPGKISKRNGQIGVAKGFAIFPSYEMGDAAHIDSLKATYGNKSLSQMIRGYAPKHENKTAQYLRFLRKETGVKDDRKINAFSDAEFEKLWRAMEKMEGTKIGTIRKLPALGKITRVRKNKKRTIVAYYLEGTGWISKDEAIRLARAAKIDAIVATSRSGKLFVRTRPDVVVENNLENMG